MLRRLKTLWRKDDELRLQEAYIATFETENGKLVLAHLLKSNYFVDSTVDREDLTPQMMSYREGRRGVPLSIISRLQLTDEQISEMYRPDEGLE
jgi:hypothetical protein